MSQNGEELIKDTKIQTNSELLVSEYFNSGPEKTGAFCFLGFVIPFWDLNSIIISAAISGEMWIVSRKIQLIQGTLTSGLRFKINFHEKNLEDW